METVMAFLAGSLGFDRFQVNGETPEAFGPEHLELMEKFSSGKLKSSSEDASIVGFLGGQHLFDQTFSEEKNIIHGTLHAAMRIDTNQIPSAIRKAWLQIELNALLAENPERRPTKAEREEAKQAVEDRCQAELATGKYHRMAQFPILWDSQTRIFYFGGSGASACNHCADLMERVFNIELERISAGKLARNWAQRNNANAALDDISPAVFHPSHSGGLAAWANSDSIQPDFLGNEFFMWLWHSLETQSDTITLTDGSEVTAMFAKNLVLECPLGESGKETISSEIPTKLPEALEAIRNGKMPRKAGLVLVRFGQQYELNLQAEMFSVGGAKLQADKEAKAQEVFESRIDAIRTLNETIDLLFESFCQLRVSKAWGETLDRIAHWITPNTSARKRPAA
jgi:hypothetical protein